MNGLLITKNLSKKHRLKKRKQKLIDRINQCTSEKELDGWEKTFSYHDILKDDFDWDYCFLLDLIEFKLVRMREFFYNSKLCEDDEKSGNICNKLIQLLHAGYKSKIITKDDLKTYVNTRNIQRFFTPEELDFYLKKDLEIYFLPSVRAAKAKALFWKYLHTYIECLWN